MLNSELLVLLFRQLVQDQQDSQVVFGTSKTLAAQTGSNVNIYSFIIPVSTLLAAKVL